MFVLMFSLFFFLKDEMIRRVLLNNLSHATKRSSYLLSSCNNRIPTFAYYHSDSIEDNLPDESFFEEQRLSSNEATKILRTHEASIDLEANCPVKYYAGQLSRCK